MTYVDIHPKKGAFLGNQLAQLSDLIVLQGDELLKSRGLRLPSRAVSSVLLIAEKGQISAADIAKELNQPHQLVTQRIDTLIGLGLVKRRKDSRDNRRKILELSDSGKDTFEQLESCLYDAEQVFLALYREIEVDLAALVIKATKLLSSKTILERIPEVLQLVDSDQTI